MVTGFLQMNKNHYEILGLKNFSSIMEIKKAYRSLALKYHPDRGGNINKMKEINSSYDFLIKNKLKYDRTLQPIVIDLNGFNGSFYSENGTTFTYGWTYTTA